MFGRPLLAAGLLSGLAGCGRATPAPAPAAAPVAACALMPTAMESRDSLAVLVSQNPALAHPPAAENDGEALLYRQVYETLVELDCHNRAAPGLATSWRREAEPHTWTFTLRESARFSDGTPVTGEAVQAAWAPLQQSGRLYDLGVEATAVANPGTIQVVLRDTSTSAMAAILGDPRLAVVHRTVGSQAGSGPYRIEQSSLPVALTAADRRASIGRIVFVPRGSDDPRDRIERDADFTITSDPALIQYARTRRALQTHSLPWSQTYRLIIPGADSLQAPANLDALRRSLADLVVSTDARPTTAIPGRCVAPAASPRPQLVYPAGDATAAQLASRLVALSLGPDPAYPWLSLMARGQRLRAVPLDPAEFDASLAAGMDAGYVTRGPVPDPVRCERGIPLISTRSHVISRGRMDAEVDGHALVRFVHPGLTP